MLKTIFSQTLSLSKHEPYIVFQGEAESKSYCWVKTRHSEMKQSLCRKETTSWGPLTLTTHKSPWRWSWFPQKWMLRLQEMWHITLTVWIYIVHISLFWNLSKKFKIHNCMFVVKFSQSRKAKFLWTPLLNPNSFHRSATNLGKNTRLSRHVILKYK